MKNLIRTIDWNKGNGLTPAVVQDADTGTVLMLGYMNRESLAKTIETKKVWFYSRSKKRLWMKGETSGNYLNLFKIAVDCDGDVLLIQVKPKGPTCHTGQTSCFGFEQMNVNRLFAIIEKRKAYPYKGSYTASLLQAGVFKICSKVAEESGEVIKAATRESKKRLIEEGADLLYYLMVLLVSKDVKIAELNRELQKRRKLTGK